MMDDDFSERQEDELQVLQAIFMDDVEDLRTRDAWKVKQALRVRLKLTPQQSCGTHGEIHTRLDMVVKCPLRYPEEIPDILLENSKGLSNKELDELKGKVDKLAIELKGEVMLLELAQAIQQYLHKHNRPPAKSFYEEMMSNKREQEERLAQEQQKKLELLKKKEEKQRQLLEDEIERRKAALKVETRKVKLDHHQESDSPLSSEPSTPSAEVISCSPIGTPGTPLRRPRVSVSPSPLIVLNNQETNGDQRSRRQRRTSTPHRNSGGDGSDSHCKDHVGGVVVLAFNTKSDRTINRGTCLGHSRNGSTVYAGIDVKTGELVAVVEWVLKWHNSGRRKLTTKDEDKDITHYAKQVMSIEQEVNSLVHLHHPNLIHYLSFKYQKEADRITVYVLMEYCNGLSMDTYTKKGQPVTIDLVKHYTEDLLHALEYIHSKDVVHKNLRPSSVFVDNSGKVRLSDYSLDRRLTDLFQLVEASRPGVHFTDHRSLPAGRGGKKGDVFQLGLILLSIARGEEVMTNTPDIPTIFPVDFQDFLTKCLLKDDRHRWAVHELLEHPFIKSFIPLTVHYTQVKPPDSPQKTGGEEVEEDNREEEEEEEEEEKPFITAFEASGQSRLTNEFEILKSLGKGGFGDVLKVKNKLDARMYAIKRIPLNPRSKLFNRKITREVKLLSRLNHENVVRYYNSWIETSEDPAESDSSLSSSNTPQSPVVKTTSPQPTSFFHNTLNMTDDLEKYVPKAVPMEESIEWSMSYDVGRTNVQESDSEDEEDVFGASFLPKSESSEDIVFEHSLENLFGEEGTTSYEPSISSNKKSLDTDKKGEITDSEDMSQIPRLQYLYIQMEYCEKSTLRNCIDAGLYHDQDRLWRFFREIIEGIQHIHQQGMIHRDLKPVNIFLDSNDHVKIGDFGLATTNIILKQQSALMDVSMLTNSLVTDNQYSSQSGSIDDGNLTGKVGTALYVSPEMMTGESKIIYSQKVDMYSMGIIFFEMCFKPLPTGMERVKILSNLRLPEIKLPDDYDQVNFENQTRIIKWLLNHDPSKRPTSTELLQSPYLPPPQLEEAELNEVLRSTISNTNSKAYRRMIGALFSQTINSAVDVLYDTDYHKVSLSLKNPLIQQLVRETLTRLFQKHGAVQFTTPLLMPKCSVYGVTDPYTCLIDHSGQPVTLPFDLRVPFARYIARGGVQHLKRFCIDRVYREKMHHIQHPREITECAFDIVTHNQGNLIPDAELLVLVQDVINEFPVLQTRNYYVRMNHVSILHAILSHNGVPDELRDETLRVLTGVKIESQNKSHIKALTNLGLSESMTSSVLSSLEMEGPYKKVSSYLRIITKTKGPAATLAKQGIHEVEAVMGHAEAMGLKLPIVFSLGCIYNTQQYSGVIFQIVYDSRKKKRTIPDLIAAGGRYNGLVKKFQSPLSMSTTPTGHSAVGVSIAFEKIVTAVGENKEFHPPGPYDILVCTIGYNPMLKERMGVVKDLWAAGLRADILLDTLQSLEDIQEYCRTVGITYLVILKDADTGCVRVRSIERERVTEKKLNIPDLADYLQPKNQTSKIDQNETQLNPSGKSSSAIYQPHSEFSQSSSNLTLNFSFILMEGGRLAANLRRKLESQIFSKVSSSLSWVQTKSFEVVCVELTAAVLKVISAFLDFDNSEKDYEDSVAVVMEKLQRHRKYLSKITDQLYQLKFEKKCSFVVLYGSKDDSLRLLM